MILMIAEIVIEMSISGEMQKKSTNFMFNFLSHESTRNQFLEESTVSRAVRETYFIYWRSGVAGSTEKHTAPSSI